MKDHHTNEGFRILEYDSFFKVQRRVQVDKHWFLFWIFPIKTGYNDKWKTMSKCGHLMNIRNCFLLDFDFDTKQECINFIDDFKEYPICHYAKRIDKHGKSE